MFPLSASFVKMSIIFLGLLTFIFNITFLLTVSKTRVSISKYNLLNLIETRIVWEDTIDDVGQKSELHGLSQHMWLNVCCSCVDSLCNVPPFPKAPNERTIINGTEFSWPGKGRYAERIFGFLRSPKTASYRFAISSDDSSEIWLSSDEKSENSVLIAKVGEKKKNAWTYKYDYWKYSTQISNEIKLIAGKKYFIDIIHVQFGHDEHLIVQWKDSVNANFSDIPLECLSPYFTEDSDTNLAIFHYDVLIPEAESCRNLTTENPFLLQRHLTYAEHDEFKQVLPVVDLGFLNEINHSERSLKEPYESLSKHFHGTNVYPFEPKVKNIYEWDVVPWDSFGMGEEDAMAIVASYMDRLNSSTNETYILKSVVNIETTNVTNGSRYLLELDLMKTTPNNKTIHLSEYLYQDKNNHQQLYYIDQMQWKRNAKITFVITAKNQGTWLQIFLDDMAKFLRQTRDSNVDIIIFDYESQDLDLKKAVRDSCIGHRIKTVGKPGRYSRRESFNMAIDLVDDPHSIVFLVDLHLKFGEALLNDIRKHTIEGHLIYCPIIVRQFECSTLNNLFAGYYGYYEVQGFGIVAMYKSDWDRVGGFTMDDKNKYKWGGDDYDLMDSVYLRGLDYARVKCPYVYHFFHSKDGMWS